MKVANYDGIGNILGFYDTEIHKEIPEPFLALTEEQWLDCSKNIDRRCINVAALALQERPPLVVSLVDVKLKAIKEINDFATEARRQIVGFVDEVKLAEYADKAAMAPRLIDRVATEDEQAAALGDPWVVAKGITDSAAVGAEWMRQANRLRGFRNKVNQLERDGVTSIQVSESADLVKSELNERLEVIAIELDGLLKLA